MKKFRYILYILALAVFAGAMLPSCSDDEPRTEPDPEPKPVNRVVLVYMSANNNLGGYFDANDLKEMKQAAVAGDIADGRLLVYRHGLNADETAVEQRLFEILPDGTEKILVEYDSELSSVSMERMGQVLDDAERLAPAESRGLMLWSHADGWINVGFENPEEPAASPKGFGQDGSKKMSISALGRVLEGRYFDFIYFDCCYMASVEVMYELRKSAGLFAASSAELPADGARYHEALKYLFQPELDLVSAVKVSFDYYKQQNSSGCTLSVVRSDALEPLAAATAEMYDLHPSQPQRGEVQQFENSGNRFFDFDHYMEKLLVEQPSLYNNWKTTLDAAVCFQGATERIYMVNRFYVRRHCGLTTHILYTPEDAAKNGYNQLKWYRDVVSRLYQE